ncbi:MAG TPA: chemotaxis protein CheW [Polyangiaceae bacterium]
MLLCRVREHLCALPLSHVVETMRPLRLDPFAGMPAFVVGISLIRGDAVPVVDPGVLLGLGDPPRATRFVVLRTGPRRVALAVEVVIGVRELMHSSLKELPPLMSRTTAELVTALSTLDAELLLVLHATRVLPESVWQAISTESVAP